MQARFDDLGTLHLEYAAERSHDGLGRRQMGVLEVRVVAKPLVR